MFTLATKNFGVWKEERKENKLFYYLSFIQFVVALSVMAFVVFMTFIVAVKIRQDFFLIESAPVHFFKSSDIPSSFLMRERTSALSIFISRNKKNLLQIYFESGARFTIPNESSKFIEYLEKRKRNIVYMAMVSRINGEQNSRIKIWTDKNISFQDVRFIMKTFSQYGFDSFDFGLEQ